MEHGFRRISARIPFILPEGHEDTHVPTFCILLYSNLSKKPWAFSRVPHMNPTILGVLGPGFLNQAPTLPLTVRVEG